MANHSVLTPEAVNVHNASCTIIRRRQLFPSNNDDCDELGSISLLEDATPPNSPMSLSLYNEACKSVSFNRNSIDDYIILENLHNPNKDLHNTEEIDENNTSPVQSTIKIADNDTPVRKVPDIFQETPQSVVHENHNIPKLIRKSPHSAIISECANKRKNPFEESPPNNKQLKLDQGLKVRTVLFPQSDITVPTASFYSKSNNVNLSNKLKHIDVKIRKLKQKSSTLFLCARKKRYGQINAGVRHNIKKPKKKIKSDSAILKAAINILENSELNEFFDQIERTSNSRKADKNIDIDECQLDNVLIENNTKIAKREPSPLPDLNKKFFKYKRNQNATVTLDKHVKLKMDDGRLSLINGNESKKRKNTELDLDASDLTIPANEDLISHEEIDNILLNLDNNKENNEQVVLHAHNSIIMSENSIHLHTNYQNHISDSSAEACGINANKIEKSSILLSPTSQMCNMTSVLALNSPKKVQQNINLNFNEISSCVDVEQEKLFPIFYAGNKEPSAVSTKTTKEVRVAKRYKPLPKNQLLLDAGQKRFGVTQCPDCKIVYHMGDPNEELLHLKHHSLGSLLNFKGWKDEHVVAQFPNNERIIRVFQTDPKPWIKKVKELLTAINRELGYFEMDVNLENCQVFIYIKQKSIAGCVVAEPKTVAYRMLSSIDGVDLCSEESYPIKCGVSRIWVTYKWRKCGLATAMLNCLRGNFMFGNILNKDDVAFSSPTEAGKAFAQKYFNTPNFLIYT